MLKHQRAIFLFISDELEKTINERKIAISTGNLIDLGNVNVKLGAQENIPHSKPGVADAKMATIHFAILRIFVWLRKRLEKRNL
jgi:hypothetical protein